MILHQTVREEVDAAWGDTDVFISASIPIRQVTEIPQSLVEDIRGANLEVLTPFKQDDFFRHPLKFLMGRLTQVSHGTEHNEGSVIGTLEEGLSWFELEEINRFSTTPQVVVNQVFSDELEGWR